MPPARLFALTFLAMIAFAGNSLLCRAALRQGDIDAAMFTTVRIASGALVLWLLARNRGRPARGGNWPSAVALFAYAAGFSLAYVQLPAATGALLLFGAVQATMVGQALLARERQSLLQRAGLALAIAGLLFLLLPGLSAPPVAASLLMLGAGVAWGVYSLRGRAEGDPVAANAGNFMRAMPMAAALSLALLGFAHANGSGVAWAILSGAVTSGLGYAIWYAALPSLTATTAAAVQLSVPAIAAVGGVLLLGEPVTARLLASSLAILGGIALVIRGRRPA